MSPFETMVNDEAHRLVQQYVDTLLGGIDVEALGGAAGGVCIVCADYVRPPAALEQVWHRWATEVPAEQLEWACPERMAGVSCIVTIADLMQDGLVDAIDSLCAHLLDIRNEPPRRLILPILHPRSGAAKTVVARALSLADRDAVDEVIWNPADGFSFAYAVRAKTEVVQRRSADYDDRLGQLEASWRSRQDLTASVHHLRWEHMRTHQFQAIPPLRPDVRDHGLQPFIFGRNIMRTPLGTVFSTRDALQFAGGDAPTPPSSVLVIEKLHVRPIASLRMINDSVSTIDALTRAPHPNLPQLIDAFQTHRRLYIHMEHLGDCTLFSRLRQCDAPKHIQTHLPLSTDALEGIIAQTTSAVVHLHQVMMLAHRGLRPENILICENGPLYVHIKVCGLEWVTSEQVSSFPCGRMPYAAPEVMFAHVASYDCKSADMWGLGVLFTELMCGVKSVSHCMLEEVSLDGEVARSLDDTCPETPSQAAALWVREFFADPNSLPTIFSQATPEARCMLSWVMPLVTQMVTANPALRLSALATRESLAATFHRLEEFRGLKESATNL